MGIAHTHGKLFEISVEAYYKTMTNLIEYKDGASFFGTGTDWESKIEVGNGVSYGAELLLEKKHGKTTGWVGYTLSWTNRQFENLNFGEVYPIFPKLNLLLLEKLRYSAQPDPLV